MISSNQQKRLTKLSKKVNFWFLAVSKFLKFFLDKLCELIPEDDFDVVRALLLWDYTDEMELEEDEHGKGSILYVEIHKFVTLVLKKTKKVKS